MKQEYIETDRRRGLVPGRTWSLMALVAVITAMAIWLVPVDEEQAPSLPPLPSVPDMTAAPPPSPATASPELESLPPPSIGIAATTSGGDRARTFIDELRADGMQPDADRAFAEAERMQGAGNLEDAYLLYRFAARHGQAQAALTLGTQADPAFHTAVTSYLPEPDPGQAHKWYSVAAVAGNDEAALSLQALRQRLQQDAEAGDEQARRLLLQWR
jgi:hypothetical protein